MTIISVSESVWEWIPSKILKSNHLQVFNFESIYSTCSVADCKLKKMDAVLESLEKGLDV